MLWNYSLLSLSWTIWAGLISANTFCLSACGKGLGLRWSNTISLWKSLSMHFNNFYIHAKLIFIITSAMVMIHQRITKSVTTPQPSDERRWKRKGHSCISLKQHYWSSKSTLLQCHCLSQFGKLSYHMKHMSFNLKSQAFLFTVQHISNLTLQEMCILRAFQIDLLYTSTFFFDRWNFF